MSSFSTSCLNWSFVYYLMSIHQYLPPQARRELKEVGWTKGVELAKLARRDSQDFDCATSGADRVASCLRDLPLVKYNLDGKRRQYGLADRARALGWLDIDVIDDDLRISGRRNTPPWV